MKILLRIAAIVMVMAVIVPANAATIVPNAPVSQNAAGNEDPRARQLIERLEEIRGLNKTELSRGERKALRKEVRGIQKEMKAIKGGVYLSVGAIIIIILVLILIL